MTVEHDAAHHRFVLHLPGGDAELDYEMPDRTTINLRHTEVPESERGHGAADLLAKEAFTYARAQGLRVIPTCRFVRRWLDRHPAERDIVAK
jgi:predicted GNAT family acetyltransferase